MNEKKFDGKGEIYSKYRPNYPQEFIDYIYTDINTNSIIADIGAGTGILTRQLLEKGNVVYAVEPNEDMRKMAKTDLKDFDKLILVNGTAENTNLENRSVDVITVAQAFHWFNVPAFKKECKRILKENGKVVLVWNCRDFDSELILENHKINERFCPEFKGFSGGMGATLDECRIGEFFDENYEIKVIDNPITFDETGFIGRNLSASYALKETDKDYNNYIFELKALFNKYSNNNLLLMPNFTRSYSGHL